MWATVVVGAYPVADGACHMLNAVEALAMDALFLEGSDYTLDHAVLLGAMPRVELLFQPIATNQRGIAARCKDQPVKLCEELIQFSGTP
jgi:hypothetical protein